VLPSLLTATFLLQQAPPAAPEGLEPAPPASEGLEPAPAASEGELPEVFFLGFHGVVFAPVGPWTRHALAGQDTRNVHHPPGLDQFGAGGGGVFEIGAKWLAGAGFAVQIDVTSLSTGEWDDYAAGMGTPVDSWAVRMVVDALLLVDFVQAGRFRLEGRLGLGYQQAWGGEDYIDEDLSYDYTFLAPSFSLRTGVGGSYVVVPGLEGVVLVDFLYGPPGVQYPSGTEERPYLGFNVSLGMRLFPAAM
jgi:hypothetical protein